MDGGASTVTQGLDGNGDATITYSSVDTITRVKGGAAGSLVTGDVEFTGGSNVTVSQAGNTISIASIDTNTVTRLASGSNVVTAGDFKLVGTGATSVSQATAAGVTTLTISSINSDTGASLTASNGVILSGADFQIKNAANFSGNTVVKWDSGNSQLANSLITDNGSTVTIGGDLVVDGTQTTLNTTTLIVEDNIIELRKGNSLVANDGGIQVNLTSDVNGSVTTYQSIQWYNAGGYWRSFDGSVDNRFVTENETQVLTNKTLTSPTLTAPTLGAATATSVNGLEIVSTASASIDIASTKVFDVDESLLLTSDNSNGSISANFRQGGNVAYTSDTLATFASTTSTQMRGLITDTTGLDKLVFQTNPTILTGITTTSTGFNLLNSGATSIQFGGAAGSITMGAATGTTTINHDLVVTKDLTVGVNTNDTITFNGVVNSEEADILIRGTDVDAMSVGRGGGAVNTNTRVGVQTLQSNTSGSQNTAFGYQSLFTNNAGASNTALGHRVLRVNGVGSNNIGVGKDVLLVNLSGSRNIGVGNNVLESNQTGNSNVCIGHYAGFDVLGSNNVLIGPAYNENSSDVTFRPLDVSGDNQLVIGSGGQAWIRGDSNYDITLNNDLTVDGDAVVKGNLTVNGVTTTIKSNIIQITDKNIELAAVVSTQFTANTTDGSANIANVAPTLGLIPGMEVISNTAGITVPGGTTILSITGNSAVLTNNVTGSGAVTFSAIGPSDSAAEDGGLIVKGLTDKTFLWKGTDGGVTYNTWLSSEHKDLASSKNYYVNGILIASDTSKVIGPTNGGGQGQIDLGNAGTPYALGSAVTTCGAPSFAFTGTGSLKVPNGTTAQRDSSAETGMLRWNTTTGSTEVYDGAAWGNIGGGAIISTTAPSAPNPGDLWYDSDDGRLFVYYNDGATSQWVDSSPYGLPTNLVVDGTATFNSGINLGDNDKAMFGDNDDLQISHDGSTSIIDGRFHPIEIRHQSEVHIKCVDDGSVTLYHNNLEKLETTSYGVKFFDNVLFNNPDTTGRNITWEADNDALHWEDNTKATFGSGNDFEIYHNGSNSIIGDVGTGNLQLQVATTTRLEATSTGATIYGNLDLPNVNSYITGGGHSVLQVDSGKTYFYGGTSGVEIRKADNSAFIVTVDNDGNSVFFGDIEPGVDATQDLGSSTKRWANIYSADLQLSNEGAANDVDGTWGNYTIQEGEEDLFLINRRSGKKYKFNLTEVQ